MENIIMNIQYFADGAAGETEPKVSAKPSDNIEEKKEANKLDFDELVRGDYRQEYNKKVEEIIKNRLKDHYQLKKSLEDITEALNGLKDKLGIKAKDNKEIISQITERLGKADSTFNVKETNSSDEVRNEKNTLTNARGEVMKLLSNSEKAKEYYPQFDIKKELKDPEFRKILKFTGNDPKKAFEILHFDEIVSSIIRDTAKLAQERMAGSIAAKASRPVEGAQSASSTVYINQDPKSLSKADRADIKRRVRRGEKIVW